MMMMTMMMKIIIIAVTFSLNIFWSNDALTSGCEATTALKTATTTIFKYLEICKRLFDGFR